MDGDRLILRVDNPVLGNAGLRIFVWFDFDVASAVLKSLADDLHDQIRSIGIAVRFPAIVADKNNVRLAELTWPQPDGQRGNEYFPAFLSGHVTVGAG